MLEPSFSESSKLFLLQANLSPILSQALYTVSQLNLADFLAQGVNSVSELAALTGTHASSLERLLRFLSGFGIVVEDEQSNFALTPIGDMLRTDNPYSPRDWILFNTELWRWEIVQEMREVVTTGKTAYETRYQQPIYEVFAQKQEWGSAFNKGMKSWSSSLPSAVLKTYDFSQAKTIVDVGGGMGVLLTSILEAYPKLKGILFDLPNVVRDAKDDITNQGLAERCELVGGNFLNAVPTGGDLYIISYVFTDWSNEDCIRILKNCSRSMAPGGKIIILEPLLGSRNEQTLGKTIDMIMLLETGGRIRDEQEWKTIVREAGFTTTNIIPTGDLSIYLIEAVSQPC
jgi:ubiquinone/menaquinone biosynthesis C-methylase UbiE